MTPSTPKTLHLAAFRPTDGTKPWYESGMAMALPKGMIRHRKSGILWARKDVPKELREALGQTSLKASLRTKDVNAARPLFHSVMQGFESRIASARKQLATGNRELVFPMIFNIPMDTGQAEAFMRFEALKPHNQLKAAADRIEAKLAEAGMVASTPEPTTLDELFARWVKERQPTKNSEAEFLRAKDSFKTLNGDLPISSYTTAHVRAWKDKVLGMTAPSGKPLAHATRVKWFSSVGTLFGIADRNDLLTSNPFAKIVLEKSKRERAARREEWETGDLNKLFASPVYAAGKRPKAGKGEAAYWMPVLALFHGFRAGELAQLDRADVVKKSGLWCLSITDSTEDAEADAKRHGKSVKTANSVRVVPIHSAVIALGFIDYVQTIKSGKLWPKMKPDSIGRWAGNWSKWFGRYRTGLGLGGRWRDFHSFRHGWKSAARGAGIPEDIHDEITGHENGSVGRGYGSVPITRLKNELEKIAFDVTIPKWRP